MWPFHHAALRSFQLGGGNRRKCLAMLKAGMAKVPHNLMTKQKKKKWRCIVQKVWIGKLWDNMRRFFFFPVVQNMLLGHLISFIQRAFCDTTCSHKQKGYNG